MPIEVIGRRRLLLIISTAEAVIVFHMHALLAHRQETSQVIFMLFRFFVVQLMEERVMRRDHPRMASVRCVVK